MRLKVRTDPAEFLLSFLLDASYPLKVCPRSPGDRVNGSSPRGGLQTPIFDRPSDWDREIKRTGASEWRVCSINEGYAICPRLSPKPLNDGCWRWNSSVLTSTPAFHSYSVCFGKAAYLHCDSLGESRGQNAANVKTCASVFGDNMRHSSRARR